MKNKVELTFEELYLKGIVVLENYPSRIHLTKDEKSAINKLTKDLSTNNVHSEGWHNEALLWLKHFQDSTGFIVDEYAKWYLIAISKSALMFKIHFIYNIFHIHYLGLNVLNRSFIKEYTAEGIFDEMAAETIDIYPVLDDFISLKLFFMRPPSAYWRYNEKIIEYIVYKINSVSDIEYHKRKNSKYYYNYVKVTNDPYKDVQSCLIPFHEGLKLDAEFSFVKNKYWHYPAPSAFSYYYSKSGKFTHFLNFESNRKPHFDKMAKQFLRFFEWIACHPNRFPLDHDELQYLLKLKTIESSDFDVLMREIDNPFEKEITKVLEEYSDNFFKINDRLKLMFMYTSTSAFELRVNFLYLLIISKVMGQDEFDDNDFYNYYSKEGFLGSDTLDYLEKYQPEKYGIHLLEQLNFSSTVIKNLNFFMRKNTDLFLNINEMLEKWEKI